MPTVDQPAPASQPERPQRDTSETRRAARNDLLVRIGQATESNLALGKILRDAFALIDEMTAFSHEFDATSEATRSRADLFAASVAHLQSQSQLIEDRLVGASNVLIEAHSQSQAALLSVEDLTGSIDDIERVIKMISAIATNTNLLALNATIEAARAGAAGAGFRVVAEEVKSLSQATQRAADEIVASVKRIRERALINLGEVKTFDSTVASLEGVFEVVRASILSQSEQTREIRSGSDELATLAQKVRSSAGRLHSLGDTVKSMTSLAEKAAVEARQTFGTLADRAAIVLRQSDVEINETEQRWPVVLPATITAARKQHRVRVLNLATDGLLIEAGADLPASVLGETLPIVVDEIGQFSVRLLAPTTSGYEAAPVDASASVKQRIAKKLEDLKVSYQPYIERVRAVAQEAGMIMEQALADGLMRNDELFDTDYRRDGATEPAQYLNRAVVPLERCMRGFIDGALIGSPVPDFCFLQDRNGFAAIHNSRYSKLARPGDAIWNARNARTRRIFDDQVGMSASRNLKPFMVHSYARDMGDAIEIRMEFDAPVFVSGVHWGAIRMAYKLDEALATTYGRSPR